MSSLTPPSDPSLLGLLGPMLSGRSTDWNALNPLSTSCAMSSPYFPPPPANPSLLSILARALAYPKELSLSWASHDLSVSGVYAVFYQGSRGGIVTLKVGQTDDVGRRKGEYERDASVMAYATPRAPLQMIWAPVNALAKDGVERYLGEALMPIIGHRFPDAVPIKVNLPY